MKEYVYIIRGYDSGGNKRDYVGYTKNLKRRMKEHLSNKVQSTKWYADKKPLMAIELINGSGRKLEYYLKRHRNLIPILRDERESELIETRFRKFCNKKGISWILFEEENMDDIIAE